MIARPRISRNERKTAERGVGKFARAAEDARRGVEGLGQAARELGQAAVLAAHEQEHAQGLPLAQERHGAAQGLLDGLLLRRHVQLHLGGRPVGGDDDALDDGAVGVHHRHELVGGGLQRFGHGVVREAKPIVSK